jgi:hypothetical protein
MTRTVGPGALLAAGLAGGCSLTFNWREVRVEPTPLTAMLPCKPDKAKREVPMAGRKVERTAWSCEAGGATSGALALPQSLEAVAAGRRSDGSAVESHAACFAHGSPEDQAVIYGGQFRPEETDGFFAGLRLP